VEVKEGEWERWGRKLRKCRKRSWKERERGKRELHCNPFPLSVHLLPMSVRSSLSPPGFS